MQVRLVMLRESWGTKGVVRHGGCRGARRVSWGTEGCRGARRESYPMGTNNRADLRLPGGREASGSEAPALIEHHVGRVHELFAAHAAARPHAIAVSGPDETLTYGQLERRANQLAHRLRALGVDRHRLVGLCMERSAGLVVGALGILKAGCAYV